MLKLHVDKVMSKQRRNLVDRRLDLISTKFQRQKQRRVPAGKLTLAGRYLKYLVTCKQLLLSPEVLPEDLTLHTNVLVILHR